MRTFPPAVIVLCACLSAGAFGAPVFTPGAAPGEFRFDTGALRGVFRENGASLGLNPAIHVKSGADLGKTPGLMNHYRVFTTAHRHGESMRGVPSTAEVTAPDTVTVRWPSGEDRPFTLSAVYQWSAPDTLDVETTVEAGETLPDFEVFLSSYFSPLFPETRVWAKAHEGPPQFIAAGVGEGTWQMFPRNPAAVALIQDGRWKIEPSPVDWAIRPEFAAPLLYRRDKATGLAAVVMARPGDCFAVSTPCADEAHFSMYLSLFGRTLEKGETARACARLVIAPLNEEEIVARYRGFEATFKNAE